MSLTFGSSSEEEEDSVECTLASMSLNNTEPVRVSGESGAGNKKPSMHNSSSSSSSSSSEDEESDEDAGTMMYSDFLAAKPVTTSRPDRPLKDRLTENCDEEQQKCTIHKVVDDCKQKPTDNIVEFFGDDKMRYYIKTYTVTDGANETAEKKKRFIPVPEGIVKNALETTTEAAAPSEAAPSIPFSVLGVKLANGDVEFSTCVLKTSIHPEAMQPVAVGTLVGKKTFRLTKEWPKHVAKLNLSESVRREKLAAVMTTVKSIAPNVDVVFD